ncbi:MAG: glycosyltransferase family 2 protein [Gaiella sp.]
MIEPALQIAVGACAAYLTLVYACYLMLVAAGLAENRKRRREAATEDFRTLGSSRFLPPVSILLPAFDEETTVVGCVRSLLALEYPDFELIVVDDGSRDGTLDALVAAFSLVPTTRVTRAPAITQAVLGCYRSEGERRLLVVAKEQGGKADALNAALGYARSPYVLGADADTVFAPDALTRAMRVVVQDPERVVGVTSYVEVAEHPAEWMAQAKGRRQAPLAPLIVAYQALDYMRAFYTNRVALTRFGTMLCSIGVFQIWRRDVVEELGGWSPAFTCEDIELTFRVHERMRATDRDYVVICLPDAVGVTEGPNSVRKLVAQRERWQRVTLETWWAYRHMFAATRYGAVGLLGMPFYLLTEVLAPLFELLAVLAFGTAVAFGILGWQSLLLVTVLMTLVNAVLQAGAVYGLDRQARDHAPRNLARLLALAPLELLVYRPIISWARLKGTYRFFRGDRSWNKFERNTPAVVTT